MLHNFAKVIVYMNQIMHNPWYQSNHSRWRSNNKKHTESCCPSTHGDPITRKSYQGQQTSTYSHTHPDATKPTTVRGNCPHCLRPQSNTCWGSGTHCRQSFTSQFHASDRCEWPHLHRQRGVRGLRNCAAKLSSILWQSMKPEGAIFNNLPSWKCVRESALEPHVNTGEDSMGVMKSFGSRRNLAHQKSTLPRACPSASLCPSQS